MKKLYPLLLLLILVLMACDKDDEDDNQSFGSYELSLNATATTTIDYFEYDPWSGADVFIETKTYQYPIEIFISPAKKVGSVSESNPFHFSLLSDNNENEGCVDVISSLVIVDNQLGEILLQYWTFTYNDGQINGSLSDNHIAESTAINTLWAWEDIAGITMNYPFPIANGTTIEGSITNSSIDINVRGESHNTYRKFNTHIVMN